MSRAHAVSSLPILLVALSLSACSGDAEPEPAKPSPFALTFAAVADGQHVGCEDEITRLGPNAAHAIGIADLRMYVSNLELWDAARRPVPLTLDEDQFQYQSDAGQVSLVDLTSNSDGSCKTNAISFAEGTKRTHEAITGETLVDQVAAVSFDVGVPQAVMKSVIADHTPEGAPSPLAELQWTWATGYRHFVFNFAVRDGAGEAGEGYAHVGSRDCGPAEGLALEDRKRCGFVNTPRVELGSFDLRTNVVTLDLAKLLDGIDFVSPVYDQETFEIIGEGPGVECHSSPLQPDCPTLFEHLGLDLDSGDADASKNVVFGKE